MRDTSQPDAEPVSPSDSSRDLFTYFSAIEERFNARRGSLLLLSTLDWALIETWREAGVPLQAVLRGIDGSFDRYEARALRAQAGRSRLQKVNGLAWCAQAVMAAAEQIVDASTGLPADTSRQADDGSFGPARVAAYLRRNAGQVRQALGAAIRSEHGQRVRETLTLTAASLDELAAELESLNTPRLEDLDRTLTLLEEQEVEALRGAVHETEMFALREAAERELAGVRSRLGAEQSRRVREQWVQKRLLERFGLPRLSLFYMRPE